MNPEIRFRVPEHVMVLAQEMAERYGLPEQKGKTGGASQYARGALYTAMGLALPEDLHQLQTQTYATVRQAREPSPPGSLRVEVHHRIHPDFRKSTVLKDGRPLAARTTTILNFAQGELPDFLIPYVTLSDSGLPLAVLNLEGDLSPRRHSLGELITAAEHCTLAELSSCLAKLKAEKVQRARRAEEYEARSARGKEILERWTVKHGSELLRSRLAGDFSWLELAQEEYAAHRLRELGLKSAIVKGSHLTGLEGAGSGKLDAQNEPTLATMKRLAQIRQTAESAGGVHATAVTYQSGSQTYEAIRLRVETPMPGLRTFLIDPITIPSGGRSHGL